MLRCVRSYLQSATDAPAFSELRAGLRNTSRTKEGVRCNSAQKPIERRKCLKSRNTLETTAVSLRCSREAEGSE